MCQDCTAARETQNKWPYFDPRCLWCGARLINRIGRLKGRTDAELTQRRRSVLADWMAAGHAEVELRELARGPMAVAPVGK